MSLKTDIDNIKNLEQGITNNKVSKFAYTDTAYTNNDVNGVQTYNINNEQNIPVADTDVLQVNTTIVNKGYRAQASSLTRMLVNHFFGRVSYNLNKINDFFLSFLTSFSSYLGQPNGVATLDENGRIPYSQLPESAVEFKGEWDASTNTPTLVDGTGTNGSMYYVSVGGTQNLGSGNITFLEGDRIIYDGEDEVWQKLSGGTVKTVNSISPDATGNVQLSFSNLDGTVANSQIANNAVTTAKIADVNVTTAKIANNAVTNAKIDDDAVTNTKIGETISIAKGGTGETTAKGAQYNLLNDMNDLTNDSLYSTFEDATPIACVYSNNGTSASGTVYKRNCSKLWTYIQGKIRSVLGLTSANYNGKANTAGTADSSKAPVYTLLEDGVDLNNITTLGWYKSKDNQEYPNAPATNFGLNVIRLNNIFASQVLYCYGSAKIYIRAQTYMPNDYGYVWNAWHLMARTTDTVAGATNDGDGNNIVSTYATKTEVSNTYIVDSNQKLLDWANNVAGNDYSSVLIKKGTWTSSKCVNLTTCGTKVVVGEVGSMLNFTITTTNLNNDSGLSYDTVPTSSEYYMLNVSCTITSTNFDADGFRNCTNLTNCSSTSTSSGDANGFTLCTNLANCSGTGTSTSTGNARVKGFSSCTNLTTCSTILNFSSGEADGFNACKNLTNCTSTITSTSTSNSTNADGFSACTNLTNCTSTSTCTNSANGFIYCKNLTNCSGAGISTGGAGYGFRGCDGVSKCKALKKCTTSVFYSSYASQSSNSTYACADTPEGGFNNTTNPSS